MCVYRAGGGFALGSERALGAPPRWEGSLKGGPGERWGASSPFTVVLLSSKPSSLGDCPQAQAPLGRRKGKRGSWKKAVHPLPCPPRGRSLCKEQWLSINPKQDVLDHWCEESPGIPASPKAPRGSCWSKNKGEGGYPQPSYLYAPSQKEKGFIGRPPTRVQEFPADGIGCKKKRKKECFRERMQGKRISSALPSPSFLPSSLNTPKRERKG